MAGGRAGESVNPPRYGRAALLAAAIVLAVMPVAYLCIFEREKYRISNSSVIFAQGLSGEVGLLVRNVLDHLFHMRNVLEQRWTAIRTSSAG
jgi:hypothetical protein